MPTHSGLHRLKFKKNALADFITKARKSGDFGTGPKLQSAMASLKREYRAMHLADCYIRGRPYVQCEAKCHELPSYMLVNHYVYSHGGPLDKGSVTLAHWLARNL